MQVVKLPLLLFTENMVFSNSLTYLIMKWPKLCIYQFSKQTLPSHLNCLFDPLCTVHERCTRSKTKQSLYIPKFSTSWCQNSFKYQGSKIWNSVTKLSESSRSITKIYCSKVTIKLRLYLSFFLFLYCQLSIFFSL